MDTPTPARISTNGWALAFGASPLLEDATVSVAPGEKVGMVAELAAIKAEVTRLYARWAELDRIGR
jgi:hypothetical protein